MIERERRGDVSILRLAHGRANALDLELLRATSAALDDAADARALVITGTDRIFCAGVDLFRVTAGGASYVREFLPVLDDTLEKLYLYPRPVIAAVNGHAVAGGCVIACACDMRVMSAGAATIGTPELHVGVPFPGIALEIMRATVTPACLERLAFSGRNVSAEQALAWGLVDELCEPSELLERACEHADRLAAIPPATFAFSKDQIKGPALAVRRGRAAAEDARVTELWTAETTLAAIRSYVERTIRKGS
ncbi:MAG: enoyl-CoA hydratase/isomerase family protein [Gammaproteobacteria bacterium]|nr:enoyl-CoA hydratase/isomerase family protein [Gammaproteobacteria bacterium]